MSRVQSGYFPRKLDESMLLLMLYILWQKLIKVHDIVSHLIKTNNTSRPELRKATEIFHGTK